MKGHSLGWWLLYIPMFLVGYVILEYVGDWGVNLPFWNRMPSWARVVLLALSIWVVIVAVVVLVNVVRSAWT